MNNDQQAAVLARLSDIGSPEIAGRFFDLLRRLLQALFISPNDPRLALNVRNESNRRRISVSINSRLVLGLTRQFTGKLDLMLMLYNTDLEALQISYPLRKCGDGFADTGVPACLVCLEEASFTGAQIEPLMDAWIRCCREYLPTQKASRFRKHHLPLLYEMAMDEAKRENVFSKVTGYTPGPQQQLIELSMTGDNLELQIIALDGRKLFKMSHGIFVKDKKLSPLKGAAYFKEQNWIVLHQNTGKGQAENFKNTLEIDDYVYICYGGDSLSSFARVVSKWKPLPPEAIQYVGGNDGWIYREIEPFLEPGRVALSNLKDNREFWLPSGNSTFYEVGKANLPFINKHIFIPNYNLRVDQLSYPNEDISMENEEIVFKQQLPLNTILYGPPGTGKTYATMVEAVKRATPGLAPEGETESEQRESYRAHYWQLKAQGRIRFITFHQSLSYEDFIEGIKPIPPQTENEVLSYEVLPGVFKSIATDAAFAAVMAQSAHGLVRPMLQISEAYNALVSEISVALENGQGYRLPSRTGQSLDIVEISEKGNIRVKHGAGERIYIVSKDRITRLVEAFPDVSQVENIDRDFRNVIGGSNATAYWTILNKLQQMIKQPVSGNPATETATAYLPKEKAAIIRHFDWQEMAASHTPNFVLIIDEINRGNVSQIFGELITLLEEDKRAGKPEALEVILPYSGSEFSVPPNLYIIGTMNTADRSVEALDTALRRRFTFEEKAPDPSLLQATTDGIDLARMLTTINDRLELLIDRDHTIGHAWLMGCTDATAVAARFEKTILPLLREYFYNDYSKIGLVLGEAFVQKANKENPTVFATFAGIDTGTRRDLERRPVYQVAIPETDLVAAFKTIYE